MVNVGIIGVGTVGSSVIKILESNADIIEARAGKKIVATIGAVRDITKKRNLTIKLTDNPLEIVNDSEIDIIVELMGGVDDAFTLVKNALSNGKSVVTANKALLAYHRYELEELSDKTPLMYEASTAGGIPIIEALRSGLAANNIDSIQGIMNGTTNYMLTKMIQEGAQYDEILAEAQELGYAEADPTFDVGGFDASHKLLILASIAYGIDAKPEDILIEGIEDITQTDVAFAKEFGYEIKLLGIAKRVDSGIELRVHPTMIPSSSMIAKVDGVMNAVSVVGDMVGETMYYGAGAGGDATASAVVADIIDIVRGINVPMLGYNKRLVSGEKLLDRDKIVTQYYIRLQADDEIGVLASIASVLEEYGISIESMLQKPTKDNTIAKLLFTTHLCQEKEMQKAIKALSSLNNVHGTIAMIRIEK